MATLTPQQVAVTGTTITMAAASAGGDRVPPGSTLVVRNGDASTKTVTVAVPGNSKYGQANPDYSTVVAAGDIAMLGPLPADLVDPLTGLIDVTYSAVTLVTVGAVTV